MNTELPTACKCFGLYDDENIVGFIGIMHRPHPINKKFKGVSRLVILPDYQGIGLGSKFLQAIAELYTNEGWDFVIRTSAKNLVMKLYKDPRWIMYSCETMKRQKTGRISRYSKALRTKCKTAGFRYKG